MEGFTFDEKTHSYFLDGKPMTGITSVIGMLAKPALIGWAAKQTSEWIRENCVLKEGNYYVTEEQLDLAKGAHARKKTDAGTHGTDAHTLVEEWVKNRMDNRMSTTDFTSIQKFIDWATENVEKFLFSERRMHDPKLFVAGTADFAYIGKDGKKYMGDFKTSSGIYGIDYWLQVAGYKMLAEGEGDEPYDGMSVIRLGKKGDFEVQSLYEYDTYRDAFLACLTLYRAQAQIKNLIVK